MTTSSSLTASPSLVEVHRESVAGIVAQARLIVVKDDATMAAAGAFLTERVKAGLKQIDAAFDPVVTEAHRAHKAAVALKAQIAEPLLQAEKVLKAAIGGYAAEVRERNRVAFENEQRLARQKAEQLRIEREMQLEAQGRHEEADRLAAAPLVVAPVKSAPAPVKVAGVSTRTVFKFDILSANDVRREFRTPDIAAIRAAVNEHGLAAAELVGGIRVWAEEAVTAGAR